jgi:hypothetical protein
MSLERDGGMILTGENRRTRRKTCLSATLSTTNPTWIDQGANPGLRGDRPATNHLSHGVTLPSEECVPWSDIQATDTSNVSSPLIKTKCSQCDIILQSRKEQNGMTMEMWMCLVRHTGGCSCEAVPSDRPIPHIEYPAACLDRIQSRSTTGEVVLWMQRRKGRRKIN